MSGQENIEKLIGRTLLDGQITSLYKLDEIVNMINVSFLKFDDEWIRIVCTDEHTNINIEDADINKFNLKDGDFEFRIQPIRQIFPEFDKYINKKLLGFKELVHKDRELESFGLNFYFEHGLNFIIRNHDYPVDENEFLFEKTDFDDLKEK